MIEGKYNIRDKELLRITGERIVELHLLDGFDEEIKTWEIIDNISEFKDGHINVRMSYGLRENAFSPYDTISAGLGRIAALKEQIPDGIEKTFYYKIRIDASDITAKDAPYILYGLQVNDTPIDTRRITISFIDKELYGTSARQNRNIFQPYQNADMGPAIELNRSMSDTVNRIYGHDVVYFKVVEDENRTNHTFKVYEKYHVDAVKYLRVLVPNNDFKDRQIVYTDMNTVYEVDVEVHITIDNFERAFGVGVSDKLTELGAKVYRFIAGGKAANSDKYENATAEMWHEFPVDIADIPDDPELIRQLSGRQYSYDKKGRRRAEPKADYKKRIGKSPDDADALLLCFLDTHAVSFDYVVR